MWDDAERNITDLALKSNTRIQQDTDQLALSSFSCDVIEAVLQENPEALGPSPQPKIIECTADLRADISTDQADEEKQRAEMVRHMQQDVSGCM